VYDGTPPLATSAELYGNPISALVEAQAKVRGGYTVTEQFTTPLLPTLSVTVTE
jgi:hypothetical protein